MKLSAPIYRLKKKARDMARAKGIALHAALDSVAQAEGYAQWSLLARHVARADLAGQVLRNSAEAGLILVAARPEQGKTLLVLEAIAQHVRKGGFGAFFTLNDTVDVVYARLQVLGLPEVKGQKRFLCDASDNICSDHVIQQISDFPEGSVIGIDHLQLLDQRRTTAPLDLQVQALNQFALKKQMKVLCLSQVDRSFAQSERPFPSIGDVRQPNPLDLNVFATHVFLENGEVSVQPSA